VPAAQGSKDYRALPLPAIDIKEGWLFANLRNGVGIAPIDTDHFTIGLSAVFLQGYRRRDVPTGVDKLSDGVGVRTFANLRAGGFVTTVGVVKGVSGQTKGVIADASVAYPIAASSRLTFTPEVGTTWANARYNDRYFGINVEEAAASGLRRFSAGSGFKDVTGAVTASYRLTDQVTVSATGGVVTLVGDVQDSPLVEKKTRPTGLFSISYRL
jgi:outer membrane protein